MSKTWWVSSGELDSDQLSVLKLPPAGKHIVTGPPGCGKTNLLILRAKYLQGLQKQNYRILGYTQTLVRFIKAGGFIPEEKVNTAVQWMGRVLWNLEGRNIDVADDGERRRLLCEAIVQHLERHNKSGLVDTAQPGSSVTKQTGYLGDTLSSPELALSPLAGLFTVGSQ